MTLLPAVLASAAVVLGAPFVGQARAALQSALPGQYRTILGGIVAAAVVGAVAGAVVRIRDRRLLRYGLLAAAILVGLGFARATSTGNADVDAVEHFHFVEYGLVTLLYQRAWRHRRDVTALLLPLLAGLLTGICDEWLQWFVPARVGELRDVVLNGAAIACGLLFGVGLSPPARLSWALDRDSARPLASWAAATILAGAAFFQAVHLGYEISGPVPIRFRSTFAPEALAAAARDRASRWTSEPPITLLRLSREDHYLEEGLWHVQRRNVANAVNDSWSAWNENVIVETYFAPVLAFPSYAGATRWPDAQRQAAARHEGDPRLFISEAQPLPIYTWNRWGFWTVIAATLACTLALCFALRRIRDAAAAPHVPRRAREGW
jgi:VanZ family protein